METKLNDKSNTRARRNKSDLIDLSQDFEDGSSNNILNLFDPLSHAKEQKNQNAIKQQSVQKCGITSRPLELRKGDRRFRTTSAISTGTKNEIPIIANFNDNDKVRVTVGSQSDKSSTLASRNSNSSANLTSSSTDNETNKDLNKLSFLSSSSISINRLPDYTNSNSDLSQTNQIEITKKNDGRGETNKLELARKYQRSSQELVLLTEKIKSFRDQYRHHDQTTNTGLVYSPTLYSSKVREMSVKIVITSRMAKSPLNFTSSASTTVEHIICHAVCSMFESVKESMDCFMIKVTGKDEYFDSKLCLADYALVSHCWKFDLDVQLTLVSSSTVKRPYLRTSQDDFKCKSLFPDDLLSRSAILRFSDLNYEALNIIIETFEKEAQRLYNDVTKHSSSLQTLSLMQTTKAICSKMMNCETGPLSESMNNVAELCKSYRAEGNSLQDEDRYKMIEVIQHAIRGLLKNMHRLLKLTSRSLPVDYEVLDHYNGPPRKSFVDTPINMIKDQVSLRVQLVAQLKPEWLTGYHEFQLEIAIKHGDTALCPDFQTNILQIDRSFFPRLLFDEDITMSIPYSSLPREARLVLKLAATEIPPVIPTANGLMVPGAEESGQIRRSSSSTSICSTAPMYSSSPKGSSYMTSSGAKLQEEPVRKILAISTAYFFDAELQLYQGDRLLSMHSLEQNVCEEIYLETTADRDDPVVVLEFKKFPPEKRIHFPRDLEKNDEEGDAQRLKGFSYDLLEAGAKHVLNIIIHEKPIEEKLADDEKALLWDNRLYLMSIPAALPKVLMSAPSWSVANLKHLYRLIDSWADLEPVDAIQLLLPPYPDEYVRKIAVEWISKQHDDELCDYLPQLLQAFRYERIIDCPLLWLLMDRALKNVRVANLAFWLLKLNSRDKTFQERSETISNCLLWICGGAFWKAMNKQEELLTKLTGVSNKIKKVNDRRRMSLLHKELESIQDYLMDKKPAMPWAPSMEICDIEINSCSYFPSNTLPLKLAFRSCEESCNRVIKFHTYDTIFKMGDDLRQDMLAMQMIRIMEKLWLREGLDLRMVTFSCLATNEREGMVEMVQNADTLRKIQQNCSLLTGSFKTNSIDNYIKYWNTSELEYRTATDNFLHSCAGYSVATYILGICDRHNDNIMVTNSGHLFHIDFGKFLGDAQMMGAIKRDRKPFVLSADMAYVINGGDRPSKKFQTFIELCTMGFNIIRRHRNLFLNLFSLMSSAKINGVDGESVKYIDKMLMPDLTEAEAMAKFTRLIEECLNSFSTQMNFFIHNLAQLRFSNDNSRQSLLSFVPKKFTIETDGKIESLDIVHLYKKYEPEKQYFYIVRVKRVGEPAATNITRTFREFSELQMKLHSMFPCSRFHDINKPSVSFLMDIVGRNNTREVAERRLVELRMFLKQLLLLPSEISECDLIYTFFHPILRDQPSNALGVSMASETSSTFGTQEYNDEQRSALYLGSNGQVKLSISYKKDSLSVMIMHAKNLACPAGLAGPNCYAKTYLLPDPHKQTKRKTRVVRQSCHPSFMELIVYDFPLDALKQMTLQVSIWHSELAQSKAFMGSTLIPLREINLNIETTSWYPLRNF